MVEIYEFRRMRKIFDGDGSEIREQFIFAGLLLTIFEWFKKYVVDQVNGFYSDHIEIRDGHVNLTLGRLQVSPLTVRISAVVVAAATGQVGSVLSPELASPARGSCAAGSAADE